MVKKSHPVCSRVLCTIMLNKITICPPEIKIRGPEYDGLMIDRNCLRMFFISLPLLTGSRDTATQTDDVSAVCNNKIIYPFAQDLSTAPRVWSGGESIDGAAVYSVPAGTRAPVVVLLLPSFVSSCINGRKFGHRDVIRRWFSITS